MRSGTPPHEEGIFAQTATLCATAREYIITSLETIADTYRNDGVILEHRTENIVGRLPIIDFVLLRGDVRLDLRCGRNALAGTARPGACTACQIQCRIRRTPKD